MTDTQHQIIAIKELLSSIIGEIRSKSYFSYYGFCKGPSLFALLKNDQFYLYIPDDLAQALIDTHHITLLEDKQAGIYPKNFYQIPSHLLNKTSPFSKWVNYAIKNLQQKSTTSKTKLIRHLPNMNISTERILRKLGISSVESLIERGEINIFVELIQKGIDVDKSFLFRLHGAIKHQLIYTLTLKQKINLLLDANAALYEAGLRKRFHIRDIDF